MRLKRIGFSLAILIIITLISTILPAAPVMAAQGVIAIAPIGGPMGTIVTITGSGFTLGGTFSVKIDLGTIITGAIAGGNIPAGTTITVPAMTAGAHSVTVTTTGGDTSNSFTYTMTPSITPNVFSGQVGNSFTITGNGFNASVTATTFWDSTSINTVTANVNGSFFVTVSVPQSAAGVHTLVTTDVLGATTGATPVTFNVIPTLAVNSSTVNVGSQLTISGTGFGANSNIAIYINSVITATTGRTSASGSFSVAMAVPASARGNYSLSATDASLNNASTAFTVNSLVTTTPSSFTSGTSVTINGSGFVASSAVALQIDDTVINASAATTNTSGSFTISGFTVPALPGGAHTIQLKDGAGNTVTLNFFITQSFTIAPQSGAPGTIVQLTGSGFGAGRPVTVSFDGKAITTTPAAPSTNATGGFTASFVVPAGSGGIHPVTASDGTSSANVNFNVSANASMNPTSGNVGTNVTVSGKSFTSKGTITIAYDSTGVATVTADDTGTFTATFAVPQSATGTRPVVVTDGTRTVTLSFSLSASVAITPDSGYVGTPITVRGSGFTTNGQVTIKYDDTQIVTTPANNLGSFAVVFNAPVSKGGNHSIIVSDSVNNIIGTFAMDSTPPQVPTPALPADAQKAEALTGFQWTVVSDPNGVSYVFQVSLDPTFATVQIEKKGLTNPGYQLTFEEKLQPASKSKPYYWRVKAVDQASNESPWMPVQSFYVGFVLANWVIYAIFSVLIVVAFFGGLLLGMRRRPAPPSGTPAESGGTN